MIGAKMTSIQTVRLEDGTRYHEDNVHITMEFEDEVNRFGHLSRQWR